jgi:hypothetical protein
METTTKVNAAEDRPRSRRALLAGVVGGLGAWLVSAAQRAMPVEAGTGDPVRIGQVLGGGVSTTGLRAQTHHPAFRAVQMGGGTGIHGESKSGRAVVGISGPQGTGVHGYSASNVGVFAGTDTGVCVNARAAGNGSIALFGDARGTNSIALLAFGPSQLDGDVAIVGRLIVTDPTSLGQTSASQAAPSSGQVRLFARDNGRGKTQLCVQFASGEVQIVATEP